MEEEQDLSDFAFIARGELRYLKKMMQHIKQEYLDDGKVKLMYLFYDQEDIFVTADE